MRWLTLLALIALAGCNWICGKVAETVVEKATGVEVDQSGNKLTIKTKEGTVTTTQTGGQGGAATTVITNEKGEKVVMTGDDKKLRVEGEKGVVEYGGDAKVPEGFPLTVMAGASVLGNAHHKGEGKENFMLMLQSDQAPIAVADYYAAEFTGKGFKVERVQTSANGQSMASVSGRKDKINAAVTAMTDGAQAKTQVTVAWESQ